MQPCSQAAQRDRSRGFSRCLPWRRRRSVPVHLVFPSSLAASWSAGSYESGEPRARPGE